MLFNNWKKFFPLILFMVFFAMMMTATIRYIGFKKVQWENNVRAKLFDVLIAKKSKLEKSLYSRIYYTKSVAAYISLKPDLTDIEFYNLAEELIQDDSVISTMAMSKNCIIGALYPLEGHEAAIGLDLLAHPERREIVEKTIETHKTYVAGPVELVEGGMAFISYTPIFDKTKSHENNFWGLTDIVIYKDKLLEESSLHTEEKGYRFALKGHNGEGDNGAVFWGDEAIYNDDPVKINVELPYGNWILAATPIKGWNNFFDQEKFLIIILIIASTIISILIWILSKAILKIRQSEQELQAIFESMNSLVIEFDGNGKYIKIATKNNQLLFKPREYLLNKTVFEVFDQPIAELFHQSITQCLKTKKLVTIQYPLTVQAEEKWFTARISWKSNYSVIYNAFDTTEQKKYQDELIQSQESLKQLNATKDKLFSIISHDLKSPFNTLLGFMEILDEQIDELPIEKIKEILSTVRTTTNETYTLLMNLLNWAMAQRGQIKINMKDMAIKDLLEPNIRQYSSLAKKKDVNIKWDVPADLKAKFDLETMSVVIRNLISNAIKFSHRGGEIIIHSWQDDNNVMISVKDNGVGISMENQDELFSIDAQSTTKGTENEKGTGLGLILCKDFVKMNNATITVISNPGDGAEFIISLIQ